MQIDMMAKKVMTEKGELVLECKVIQHLGSHKVVKMTAFCAAVNFWIGEEIKIDWNADAPDDKVLEGFEKKAKAMLNPNPKKDQGWTGSLQAKQSPKTQQ